MLRMPLVAAAAAATAFVAPAAATLHAAAFTPRVPPGTLGINGQFLTNLGAGAPTAVQQDAQLTEVQSLGIGVIRNDTSWNVIEPNAPDLVTGAHTYHWATLDSAETLMAKHSIRWAPIIDYSAKWGDADQQRVRPAQGRRGLVAVRRRAGATVWCGRLVLDGQSQPALPARADLGDLERGERGLLERTPLRDAHRRRRPRSAALRGPVHVGAHGDPRRRTPGQADGRWTGRHHHAAIQRPPTAPCRSSSPA